MLYGSWRFINDYSKRLTNSRVRNELDIVVYCNSKTCKKINNHCTVVDTLDYVTTVAGKPRCWAVRMNMFSTINYMALNSFLMFTRPDSKLLVLKYRYILRTDYDVFLSPALLLFNLKEKKIIFGMGGYSINFNMKRLMEISAKLGLHHQGVHDIGSTWFGISDVIVEAGKLTSNLTIHLFKNEFNPKLPGLEKIPFVKDPLGKWPEWWKPVASMYAGEMAVNHLLKSDISHLSRGTLDSDSCSTVNVWKKLHIHCWHNPCDFNKFKFQKHLEMALYSKDGLPGKVLHEMMESMYPKVIKNMTVREYSNYIAWNSAGRYLERWVLKEKKLIL